MATAGRGAQVSGQHPSDRPVWHLLSFGVTRSNPRIPTEASFDLKFESLTTNMGKQLFDFLNFKEIVLKRSAADGE